jgi:capsular polysaccharide biosynthesis protein
MPMDQRNNESVEIDLNELLFSLLHKWWIILLIGIIGALITGSVSKFLLTPVFKSTSKLYVINRQNDDITTWSDMQSSEFLAKDFRILIKSRPIREEVLQNLKLNITPEELSSMISINTPEGTRILEIMVTYTDPVLAKQIVDEIAKVSSERLVNVMEIKKVNIAEEGNLPLEPSSPNIKLNTIIGGILGVFFTSLILIILHIINDTIRSPEDVEKYLGLTTLGIIPIEEGRVKNKKNAKR